jgi:hypothetical protein
MNNVALRRVSVDGTTYRIGDTVSDAHAKKIQKELGKGYIGTKADADVDTPPVAPEAPTLPNAPAPDTQSIVNDPKTPENDPDPEIENEEEKEIGDVDTPPVAPEAPTELSPEAQELLKKKM